MKLFTRITRAIALMTFVVFAFTACDEFAPTLKVPFDSESEFALSPEEAATKSTDGHPLLHEWVYAGNINSLITEKGGDPEKIKEGNIKEVTLTLVDDNEADLSSIISYLELKIDKNPSVEEVVVARSLEINQNSITFELIKDDILEYVTGADGLKFTLYGDVDNGALEEPLDVKISVLSEMVVEIL
jgi:hypothetical protein